MFKSYYVVWKPNMGRIIPIATTIGLNRTMQYGNCSIPNKDNYALLV